MHPFTSPPRDMAEAYATAIDPCRHGCHPAVMQTNWAFLKEARGTPVNFDRIGRPAHQVELVIEQAPVNEIDRARLTAIPAIRRAVRRLTLGSDPKGAA